MSARHTLLWSMKRQRYECWCGVGYEGGEKKARAQHRAHKEGRPTPEQVESVLRRLLEAADKMVAADSTYLSTGPHREILLARAALKSAVVEARQTIGEGREK